MKKLDKILQTLIINGSLTEQPGLFYGKTGIAVFFFHYAGKTGNSLFQEYAIELIEAIQKQITVTTSLRYDTGIAGIGVGFEYFLQNNFIEADDSDFFDDFDARMYRAVMYEPYPNLSLKGGLTGWGRYFIYRLRGKGHKDSILHEALTHIANEIALKVEGNLVSENEKPDVYRFFHDMAQIQEYTEKYAKSLQMCKKWNCINEPDIRKLFPYMNNLQRLLVSQNYLYTNFTKEIEQEWRKWEEVDYDDIADMGLLKGWTAEGMLNLMYFHNLDKSWLNIL